MDTTDSAITFDARGLCDHCNVFYSRVQPHWHTDERGKAELDGMVETIRKSGKGRDFDCIIGMSGGIDSSYLVYAAKEIMGLRPLVFHVDAGWNSQIAVNNIERLVDGLGLDPGGEAFEDPVGETKEGGGLHGTTFLSRRPMVGRHQHLKC
jgi:asparagine synthetase B (glutamine-hydrolysing)